MATGPVTIVFLMQWNLTAAQVDSQKPPVNKGKELTPKVATMRQRNHRMMHSTGWILLSFLSTVIHAKQKC